MATLEGKIVVSFFFTWEDGARGRGRSRRTSLGPPGCA